MPSVKPHRLSFSRSSQFIQDVQEVQCHDYRPENDKRWHNKYQESVWKCTMLINIIQPPRWQAAGCCTRSTATKFFSWVSSTQIRMRATPGPRSVYPTFRGFLGFPWYSPIDIFPIDIDWLYMINDYVYMIIIDYIYIYPNISKPWGWAIGLEYDDSWEIQCHVEPLDPWTMVMVVWNARNTSWGIRSSWCQTGSWGWSTTGPAWGDENSNDATKWWGFDAMGCGWYLRLPSHTYQYILPIHNIKERLPCMSKGKVTLVTDTFRISG